jgi:hypothetical protein
MRLTETSGRSARDEIDDQRSLYDETDAALSGPF